MRVAEIDKLHTVYMFTYRGGIIGRWLRQLPFRRLMQNHYLPAYSMSLPKTPCKPSRCVFWPFITGCRLKLEAHDLARPLCSNSCRTWRTRLSMAAFAASPNVTARQVSRDVGNISAGEALIVIGTANQRAPMEKR